MRCHINSKPPKPKQHTPEQFTAIALNYLGRDDVTPVAVLTDGAEAMVLLSACFAVVIDDQGEVVEDGATHEDFERNAKSERYLLAKPKLDEVAWAVYEAAYVAAQTDDSTDAIELQISTWERVVEHFGKDQALARFWAFMRTLPRALRSDCDPYGD